MECEIFSTIRSVNSEKEGYYTACVGQVFEVWLDEHYGNARLLEVRKVMLGDVDKFLLLLDTGKKTLQDAMGVFAKFGLNANSEVIILLFAKTSPDTTPPNHLHFAENIKFTRPIHSEKRAI